MGRLRNLIGMRFGKLEVVEKLHKESRDKKRAMWKCNCQCGETRIVEGWSLFNGKISDCGSDKCRMERSNCSSPKNMIGEKFGRLTVIGLADGRINGQLTWMCECECGSRVVVQGANLRNGNSKSCGCIRFDIRKIHGKSHTQEYKCWSGIIQRCCNPKNKAYCYYGGRGIKICQSWMDDFMEFYKYIGTKPGPEYSIERINPDGNYEPGNVKWATPIEQWENRKVRGLNFKTYEHNAGKTAQYSKGDKFSDITYCILGLASEAGEICGKWKKCIRDNGFELTAKVKRAIIDEAGDLMWYLARLCYELDVSMETVAILNTSKLNDRLERNTIKGEGDNR